MALKIVSGNVLTMLAFMLCGFLLTVFKKSSVAHTKTLSALLIYVCCPAMILSAWQKMDFSMQNLKNLGLFFLLSLAAQLLFFALLFLIFKNKLKKQKNADLALENTCLQNASDDAQYRILTVASTLGNVGFFGLPLVSALFPTQPIVACYSTVYVTGMNLIVFTLGVFMITKDKSFISVKSAIINPTTLSMLVALPLFFCNVTFPQAVAVPLDLLGQMSTPLCMFVLGIRLASVSIKKLFSRPFAYLVCLLKLVVFPLFAYLLVYFLPFVDATFKACMLVLSATPTGVIILSLAELHDCEQELSANVVLLTTLLCVLTIPLIMLIL